MDSRSRKCRICLEDNSRERMYDLFDGYDGSNNGKRQRLTLNEKVELCCRVKIRKSSKMPTRICQKCYDMLDYFICFQNLCWDSQVYLESLSLENEYVEEDFDQLYDSLVITNMPNMNKLKPSDDSEEETEDNFQLRDEEINAKGEEICLTLDDASVNGFEIKENQTDKPKKKKRKRTPSPSTFMCNICGNVYTKKSTFTYHMSTHEDIRPHECEACGKTFRQVCELKNHIRRHTGEKPFKCSYCERSFIDRSERHRHERTHTNDRPYKCKVCGKSFAYSAILKNHSKLHSGERAYNCLVCEKAFTLQHQLKAHLSTSVHKQRESEYISAGYQLLYE